MTKKFLSTLFIVCVMAAVIVTSCKKKSDDSATAEQLDAQTKQNNSDANTYKSESDDNDNDINTALNGTALAGMRLAQDNHSERLGAGGQYIQGTPTPPCGSTMDDTTQIANKTIIYTFDGTTHCGLPVRTRSGQISVHLSGASKWDSAGAVLTVTFNNYKVTRLDNGHWIQLNGVKTLINPSGFNWLLFAAGSTNITYKERVANMQVAFDDGSHAVWNSSRNVVWKCNNFFGYDFTFSTIGDTTINGFNQASEWGTNRFGTGFVTHYNSTLVANSKCSYWRPTAGELVYNILNGTTVAGTFIVTLGLDSQGNAVSSGCASYFKVTWTDSNKNTQYTILPYW